MRIHSKEGFSNNVVGFFLLEQQEEVKEESAIETWNVKGSADFSGPQIDTNDLSIQTEYMHYARAMGAWVMPEGAVGMATIAIEFYVAPEEIFNPYRFILCDTGRPTQGLEICVNGERIAIHHPQKSWQEHAFEINEHLQVGKNTITVQFKNGAAGGWGGPLFRSLRIEENSNF